MLHEGKEHSQSKFKKLEEDFSTKQRLHTFSSSEEDGEITDSLDIKPMPAYTSHSSHGSKDRVRPKKSYHGKSEKYRRRRSHEHREKRHLEKHLHAKNDKLDYKMEGRYCVEQIEYKGNYNVQQTSKQMHMKHSEKMSKNEDRSRNEWYDEKAVTSKYVKNKRKNQTEDRPSKKLKVQPSSRYSSESDADYYNSVNRNSKQEAGKRYKETHTLDSVLEDRTRYTEENDIKGTRAKKEKTRTHRTKSEILQKEPQGHMESDIITVSDSSEYNITTKVDENDENSHSDFDAAESSNNDDESVHNEQLEETDGTKETTHKWNEDEKPNFYLEYLKDCSYLDDHDHEVQKELNEPAVEEEEDEEEEMIFPPYYPAIQGCRSVNEFQLLNHIEEGTYGVVYRAIDKHSNEMVALKRLKMEREKEGFPITSLREINTLLKGQHQNVVTVREIVVGNGLEKIYIVMDYVEHDLKSLMEIMRQKKQTFNTGEVKCLLKQLLCAMAYLHDNWILHRDLKTSNLLLSNKGILKVGDFGLAREYGSPLKAYTPLVVTLWYRAPELLLCTKQYSTPIDLWSVGCIFGELLLMKPVFQGKAEIDQVDKIFKMLGTPDETVWPGFNKLPAVQRMKFPEYPSSNLKSRFYVLSVIGLTLLQRLLTYDPAQRITAEKALEHPYFNETPLPIDPSIFPTWPTKNELKNQESQQQLIKINNNKVTNGYNPQTGIHSICETENIPPRVTGFTLKF